MLNDDMKTLIQNFPLGFVATVSPAGKPCIAPQESFMVIDDHTIAYAEVQASHTSSNILQNPQAEISFVDPFARQSVRITGAGEVHNIGSDVFTRNISYWLEEWGDLADNYNALIYFNIENAEMAQSPIYETGQTKDEIVSVYQSKYASIYPA